MNVYVFNIGSICIHGKELLRKFTFHQNHREQSGEIFEVSQVSWEDSPWRHFSLVNDEEVISLSHAEVYVFSDSLLCLGKVNQNPASKTVWEEQLSWFKSPPQYRTLDTIDGESMECEWNISQDSPHCSSSTKSKSS